MAMPENLVPTQETAPKAAQTKPVGPALTHRGDGPIEEHRGQLLQQC
jgi:hypothetical protein